MIETGLKGQGQEQAVNDIHSEVKSRFERFSGKRLDSKEVQITRFEMKNLSDKPDAADERSDEQSQFLFTRSGSFRRPSLGGGWHLPWPFPHDHCTWKWCFEWEVPIPEEPGSVNVYEICIEIEYPC